MLGDDVSLFFTDFAESVTVQGTVARGIFDTASEVVIGDVVSQSPALTVPATVAASINGICTIRGLTYVIRQVLDLPPDGRIRQLVLSRA